MIPVLFERTETQFRTYGLGEIPFTKAVVTRERNGAYTFYGEYPKNGKRVKDLLVGRYLKADAGHLTKWQTFEIVRVVKDDDVESRKKVVKVYANHISMSLSKNSLLPSVTIKDLPAIGALSTWKGSLLGDNNWDVWSDIDTKNSTTWTVDKMPNALSALGGTQGSILDNWGGEYEFDNRTIRLHKQMGRKAPTTIEYGRNLQSIEVDDQINSTYTSLMPFAVKFNEDGTEEIITIDGYLLDSDYVDHYTGRRILQKDFSFSFGETEKVTKEKLLKLAQRYIKDNQLGLPKTNIKLNYIDLSSTLEYRDLKIVEQVELCDILPIYYFDLGITDNEAKVSVVDYDVLRGVNESIEVGVIGQSYTNKLAQSLVDMIDNANRKQSDKIKTTLPYIMNAQGNRIWYEEPDDTLEHKVGDVWFQKNGNFDRMYIWNGQMWEKILDTEDNDKIVRKIETIEQQAAALAEQAQQNKSDFDAIKKDIKVVSDQAKAMVSVTGNDKEMIYSDNRLDTELNGDGFDFMLEERTKDLTHNGSGYDVTQKYHFRALVKYTPRVRSDTRIVITRG